MSGVFTIKKLFLVMILLTLVIQSFSCVSATTVENIPMDYLDGPIVYDLEYDFGMTNISSVNVTNVSKDSDARWTDIQFDIIGTYLFIRSNNISDRIDYTFVNNTKQYLYNITDASNISVEFRLFVDYSSITVPLDATEKYILQLEHEVANLTENLTHYESLALQYNNTINNITLAWNNTNITLAQRDSQIGNLTVQISALQTNLNALQATYDQKVAEIDLLNIELESTNNQIDVLSNEITTQSNRISLLENNLEAYQKTANDLMSPFAITYTAPNGENRITMNIVWLVIGGGIFSLLTFLYIKSGNFSSAKAINSIGDKLNIPFVSKRRKATPEEWDMIKSSDVRPNIETEILKPIEKKKESNSHAPPEEIDPLESKKKRNIPKHEAVELEKSKQENFWDTPEGKAQLSKG